MTDYNAMGDLYIAIRDLPLKRFPERDGIVRGAADVMGKRVIDLACGDGNHTRRFMERGADEAVGVDVSEVMVRAARQLESESPLGIRYFVGDIHDLPQIAVQEDLGQFDITSAAWLLVYAETRDRLDSMARALAAITRPGGRLVQIVGSYDVIAGGPEAQATLRGPDLSLEVHHIGAECARITHKMVIQDVPMRITNTLWTHDVLREALTRAGFVDVNIEPAPITAAAHDAFEPGYWDLFIANPSIEVITAYREGG